MNTQTITSIKQNELILLSPMLGSVVALEDVPDPVFAQKMVGDGIAIEPMESILRAPFDGEITQLQSSKHAITLKHASGLEVLMHIGIDTVMLKGQGFTALVEKGQQISQGQPLIEFDIDQIAQSAKSLVTAIVITNAEGLVSQLTKSVAGTLITPEDMLLSC